MSSDDTPRSSRPRAGQLPLFQGAAARGRNARMALRLDELARDAEMEADLCRRAGDGLGVRRWEDQARAARRAAALLRAGPGGVRDLLAS